MIDKERLAQVTDVFFHASCPDGTAAAMIVADTFAGMEWEAKFHPVQYGTEAHDKLVPARGQLFVDITPPMKRWPEWAEFEPVVLDHHETARPATEGLGGVYATNDRHSGAKLAYENVAVPLFGGTDEWRQFAETAMIRDTWKKDHPLWREACAQAAALSMFGSEHMIEQVVSGKFRHDSLREIGAVLLDASERSAKKAAGGAVHAVFPHGAGEYRIAAFNCTEKVTSDAANILIDQGADIAIGYFFTHEDGTMRAIVSVRTGGRFSARRIAERNGGGGHDRASGFKVDPADGLSPAQILAVVQDSVRDIPG